MKTLLLMRSSTVRRCGKHCLSTGAWAGSCQEGGLEFRAHYSPCSHGSKSSLLPSMVSWPAWQRLLLPSRVSLLPSCHGSSASAPYSGSPDWRIKYKLSRKILHGWRGLYFILLHFFELALTSRSRCLPILFYPFGFFIA